MANEKKRSEGFNAALRLIDAIVSSRTVIKGSGKNSGTTSQGKGKTYNSADEYVTVRLNDLGLNQSRVNESFISTFLKDAQNYLNSSASKYSGMGWANRDSVYEEQKKRLEDLQSRSWDIRQYLDKNKASMKEEDYTQFTSILDEFDKASSLNDYSFYRKKKQFGEFDTEADYNEFMRQQEINGMTSKEIGAVMSDNTASQEDKNIVEELMLSNMPYNREYAEQGGRDMAIYDEVEKKRKYISDKYGVQFTESSYENSQILADLMSDMDNGATSPVAYTTKDGQNVTWQMLYDHKVAEEDLANRMAIYSKNADWDEMSKGKDVSSDPNRESDYNLVWELSLSNIAYDKETALANGTSEAEWNDIDQKRRYIGEKYGVDLYSDIYKNVNIFNELMTMLDDKSWENGELSAQLTEDVIGEQTFKNMRHLDEDEKAVLNYIFYTQGRDAALEWHNSRMNVYQNRANGVLTEEMFNWGKDSWGGLGAFISPQSLSSVALSVGSGIEQLGDWITGDNNNTMARASSAIRSGVSENTNWTIGNFDAFDFVYNTTMSGVDSYVAGKLLPFNLGKGKIGQEITGAGLLLGLSAAGQATNDALERGLSNDQAFWNGLAAGVFECLFESWSIGNFNALQEVASAHGKDIAMNIAKSMLVNASEETLTEVANIAYDSIVNGDFSQYETLVRQYVVNGYSEEEAKRIASQDLAKQVGEAAASGALMGFGFGSIGQARPIASNTIGTAIRDKKTGMDIMGADGGVDALKNLANEVAGASDAKMQKSIEKQANKVSGETATGKGVGKVVAAAKNASNATQVGKLYRSVVGSTVSAQTQADIAKGLESNGFTAKSAKNIADALAAKLNGKQLTNFQRETLKSVDGNRKVEEVVNNIFNDTESSAGKNAMGLDMFNLGIRLGVGISPNASRTSTAKAGEETVPSESKLATVAENAAESHYEVSADGKTLNAKGDEITIVGIDSVGKGKLTLKLSDGSTIDSSEVSYSSVGEAMVYETVANMDAPIDADTAFKLVKGYDPASGISAEVYAKGLNQAYTYGFYGYKRSDMTAEKALSAVLTEEQRNFAYESGREYAEKHNEGNDAGIKDAYATAKSILRNREKNGQTVDKSGEVVFEDGLTKEQITKSKNGKQKNVAYLVAQKVSAKMGNDIHLYKGTKEFGFRAKSGDIWLNVNATADAQSMMLFTLSHELVHNARVYDPNGFKAFADFLVEQYGEQGKSVHDMVLAKQADYASQGKKLSYDKAYEEVVCDACERMLLDSNALEKLQLLEQKHPGIIERIIESIRNFLKHIREVFSDVDPYADESKFVKEMETEAQAMLNRLFENMMVDSGKHYSTIKAAFGKGTVVETNADGEFTIAKSDDGSEMLYNLATWEKGGRETLQAALESEGFSGEDIKAAMAIMDAKYDLVKELGDEFNEQDRINQATITTDIKDGHSVLSALVSNGDYPVNIDLLMVCKKRKAYQRVINRLCETGMIQQATVDALAIAEINKILGKYGFETACLGCFVESRRLRIQEWANTIVKEWNSEVKKRNPNAKAFGFGKGEAKLTQDEVMQLIGELESGGVKNDQGNLNLGQGSAVKRMGVLLDKVPSLRKTLSVEDLITPDGLTALRKFDSNLFSMVKSRYGSNSPKFVQEFNPYNHELAKYGKVPSEYNSLREYLYAIGGARMQSFSDFIVENWFDYCQIVADLAARKLPMHTYTKEIALAKLFGLTGIKINMSLIPDIDRSLGREFAGLTRNAKGELELIWADKDRFKATGGKSYMQSINFADAIALQNDPRYSSNVGTIAVGVSDKHILMMLDDNRIRMIIPYHSSGMNPIFADLMGTSFYKDYTMFQNTTVKQLYNSKGEPVSLKLEKEQSNKLVSGFQFNAVLQELGDARAAAQAYKDWCAEASKHTITIKGETYTAELTPKFDSFSWHDNYYKLLEDFNTYDCISEEAAQQGDVQQVYPEDFDGILRAELTAQDKYRQKQDESQSFDKAMGEIESYLSTHSKADTVYYAEKNGIKLSDKDKKLDANEKRKLKALRDADLKMPKGMTSPTYEELVAKDPISVIDIGRNDKGLSYADLKEIVLKNAEERKVFDVPHLNRDTNVMIFLTDRSFYHAFSNLTSTFGEDTILAMDHIPEIIHEAVLANISPPKNPRKAESRVFTFFAAIEGKNGIEPVKLTVKEYVDKKLSEIPQNIRKYFEENGEQKTHNRLYDTEVLEVVAVEGIKKESGASASVANRKRLGAKGTPNSTIKIADLLGLVNGDARKYIPVSIADQEYMAAVNRGDMETVQRMVNAFSRNAGYDARMFHETDADNIHIFDISRGDHGGTDSHTPYGIFTKSSAKNIGLGSKQMELFVKAHNTLRVENREDVVNKIPGFAKYYDQIQEIDKKYDAISNRLEDEELDALQEWIEEHPDVDMDEVFPLSYIAEGKPADIDYPKYLEAHERYVQNRAEWIETYNAVAVKAKAYITDYLRSNGYDSMYFVIDGGSRGRQTASLIVLDENQVKSADPVTYDDNGDVIPLSQRFNQMNPDIRYKLPNTLRDAQAAATRKALEKQNEKLREDVSYLKELLKLQRSITGGKKITRSSVETVARTLKKELGATGNSLELAGYLNQLYSFIAESDELTWEGIEEKAQNAVAWLREHGNVEKDSFKELSDQELLRKVYDGYWGVSTLHTVADAKQKEINKLKAEHSKRMQAIKESHEKAIANLKQQQKERIEDLREFYHKSTDRKLDAAKERYQEQRQRGIENREKADVREKIRNFKKRLENKLLRPTDSQYVPIDLIGAMVEVCNLIDTDTDLYKADGSINKAQESRNLTKEKLQNLKDEYEKLKTHSDPIYAGEFDEMVYAYLTELRDKFSGKSLKEMSLEELAAMYEVLRAIDETLMDARKLIGWGDAETVYEAGDAIVAEQNIITQSRKNGKRNAAQKATDKIDNRSLSPVRNVERMAGYNQESALLKLFKKFEQGIRKKNKFVMEAYKSFESLTSGKEYDDAIYKEVGGKKYTDVNGREFGLSKMQMMQAILSYERETANNMSHIAGSGFSFADLDMLRKGKLRDAISEEYSHRVPAAVTMVAEFQEVLKNDKWCQDYMTAARKFFNETAKDAINETSIALKHRIIAKDKSYIPFEVDKNFVVQEIDAKYDVQQTINSYGMLKDTKKGASQPLIITGLNNILDRHIDQVGNVYGLAIEVRNFNKVWNVRSMDEAGNDPTVKTVVQRNWGVEGVKHIEQAVQDIQGPRVRERNALYDKFKSGYIGATFLLNLSVVTKQVGSLYSSTSMLRWRDPVSMIGNLIYTMANHKKITAEVDKYTATAWMRRQGMSDAELYTLMTQAKKPGLLKVLNKVPAVFNPTKWITAMDHAVALSLWRYAKIDTAKRTGLTGEELLKATAEFYDEVVENTQSMTDVLHRPEIQKRGDVVSEAFAMFKTDLYQMAGQLQATTGRFLADKSKENGKALGRTVYSIAMGAIWGQLMTTVFALLRYKVKPYRDEEDEELTVESWLKRQGVGLAGDLMGYIFPIFGSEVVGVFENIMYGESDDLVDSIALTAINDLYNAMITIGTSIKEGEPPEAADMKKLAVKALQVFGIPANNILRTVEAIQLHAKDIANDEFFSFEAGVDRSPKHHIHRITEAIDEGSFDVAKGLYEEALEELATKKADGGEYGDDELKEAKSSLKTALGTKYKDGEVSKATATKILSELLEMDEDDIYWTFDKWGYAQENGSTDDYAKYEDFFTAVKTGKNLKTVIKKYTDNGVSEERLNSQITKNFKPLYIEMSTSEKANIKGYLLNAMTVLGDTREEAAERISAWEFEGKHGFAYDDKKDAYLNGDISVSELKSILMAVGGMTAEEAGFQIEAYDWEEQGHEGATAAAVRKYNEHCKASNVPKDVYLHIRSFANDTENDKDANGKSIAYSAMKKIMAEINVQPGLSSAQKTAIARSLGWAEKNIQKYKTW